MEISLPANRKLTVTWIRADCLSLEVWLPVSFPEARHVVAAALELTDNDLARFLAFLDTHEEPEPEPPVAA